MALAGSEEAQNDAGGISYLDEDRKVHKHPRRRVVEGPGPARAEDRPGQAVGPGAAGSLWASSAWGAGEAPPSPANMRPERVAPLFPALTSLPKQTAKPQAPLGLF